MTTPQSTDIKRVYEGQPISAKWGNRIADRLNQNPSGIAPGPFALPAFDAVVCNDSGADAQKGGLLYLSDFLGRFEDKPLEVPGNTIYSAIATSWHDKIAQTVVALDPIPNGEAGWVRLFGQCVVRSTVNVSGEGGDGQYVMPDPADPTRMIACSGGIGRLLAKSGTNTFNILLGDRQVNFRYELTQDSEAPDTTTAKLLDLDGTEIAASINLFDPDSAGADDVTEYKGFCHLAGNRFLIGLGPC